MSATASPPDVPGVDHRTVTIATADAGPLDLHVLEGGNADGPPVLLLHGWPQHAWCWRHVIPLLADDYRIIAPDLRGFGWSDCPEGGYDPVTFAKDAVALLDALDVESAHVIGHDWGGGAAFAMALTEPGRVQRMVVLNTVSPWVKITPELVAGAWRSWYAVLMAAAGDQVVRRLPQVLAKGMRGDVVHHEGITHQDALAFAERLREPARARATKLLYRTYLKAAVGQAPGTELSQRRLTHPTRFLFGENDGAIATASLKGIEQHGDDFEVELVPDSGHFICEEKPELIAERARELFTRTPVPG